MSSANQSGIHNSRKAILEAFDWSSLVLLTKKRSGIYFSFPNLPTARFTVSLYKWHIDTLIAAGWVNQSGSEQLQEELDTLD